MDGNSHLSIFHLAVFDQIAYCLHPPTIPPILISSPYSMWHALNLHQPLGFRIYKQLHVFAKSIPIKCVVQRH